MNPYVMEVLLQEKRREMLAEAERSRLIAEYNGTKPKFNEKVLTKLGMTINSKCQPPDIFYICLETSNMMSPQKPSKLAGATR